MSEHLRLPVRIGPDGTFLTVVEDSTAEIVQNVSVILRTRLAERLATPTLGTPDPVFRGFDPQTALGLVADAEPRAVLELVRQSLDEVGREVTDLTVTRRET